MMIVETTTLADGTVRTRTATKRANTTLEEAAIAWHEARLRACAAPLGNQTVWNDLGAAETALSEAVKARLASGPSTSDFVRPHWTELFDGPEAYLEWRAAQGAA